MIAQVNAFPSVAAQSREIARQVGQLKDQEVIDDR
jgi:hypothetical protein